MKKLKKYLYLFSFLFLFFIPKAHARIIIPALPIDDNLPHIISYWGGNSGVDRLYLTYCKNVGDKLYTRDYVPSYSFLTAIGYCYDSNGGYQGYAYRRSIYAPLTKEQINDYDFEITGEWGSEQYGSSYNTPLTFNPNTSKIGTWKDYGNYFVEGQTGIYDTVVITGNTNIYELNTDTILLSEQDYEYESPPRCTKEKPIGIVNDVSDFTFNVEGYSNVLDYPIEGELTISYNSTTLLTPSDFIIEFLDYGNFVDGSYDLTCSTTDSFCTLYFNYSYQDDITSLVKFGFKVSTVSGVTMPRVIRLYLCMYNNNYDFSFDYTYTNAPPDYYTSDNRLNNFLQDGSLPDLSDLIDTSLLPGGPVDAILLLPLEIMQALLNVFNSSSCLPLRLTIPFTGGTLILPCISTIYSQINGLSAFLTWFSAIFSAFILYKYFIYLYKWVDDILTLRENTHFGGY